MLYYKGLKRKAEGKRVDEDIIEKRRKFLGLENKHLTNEEIAIKYEEAVEQQKSFKEEAKRAREKELLDAYPAEIIGDSKACKKRRRKLIKNEKKARFRQHTFNMLTRHIGKGDKSSLKK